MEKRLTDTFRTMFKYTPTLFALDFTVSIIVAIAFVATLTPLWVLVEKLANR